MSGPTLKAEGSDDIRPRGTVMRECSLCGWSTWYDPLSPEATKVPLICSACFENGPVEMTCPRCRRRHVVGHRDAYAIDRGSECQDCRALGVDAEPPMHFCQDILPIASQPTACQKPAAHLRRHRYAYEGEADELANYWFCDEHAAERGPVR